MSAIRPTRARLAALAIAATVLTGGVASPALADDATSDVVVSSDARADEGTETLDSTATDGQDGRDANEVPDGATSGSDDDSADASAGSDDTATDLPGSDADSGTPTEPGTEPGTEPETEAATDGAAAVPAEQVAQATSKSASRKARVASARAARAEVLARSRKSGVFVVGDSLTVGASSGIYSGLRSRVARVTVNGRVGRFVAEGLRYLPQRKERIWVVALGTNDGPSWAKTTQWVNWVMRKAGADRKVILVNVVRPGGYAATNNAIRYANQRYSNLSVVDWAGYVRKHPGIISGDRVHATGTGYALRARLIAQEVLRVAGQP